MAALDLKKLRRVARVGKTPGRPEVTQQLSASRRSAKLIYACKMGNLEDAQQITSRSCLTPADARARHNCALRYACRGGYLKVAQWLVDHFGLTPDDARAYDN